MSLESIPKHFRISHGNHSLPNALLINLSMDLGSYFVFFADSFEYGGHVV